MVHEPTEPRPLAGAIFHPGAGYHSYPPAKRRLVATRKTCGHCGLAANTLRDECPVCGAPYAGRRRLARLARRLARRGR